MSVAEQASLIIDVPGCKIRTWYDKIDLYSLCRLIRVLQTGGTRYLSLRNGVDTLFEFYKREDHTNMNPFQLQGPRLYGHVKNVVLLLDQ